MKDKMMLLVTMLIIVLSITGNSQADDYDATVSIPTGLSTTPGATGVQVPVNVSAVTGLSYISAQLTVNYHTNVLTATGATLTGTIAEGRTIIPHIDDASGQITIGIEGSEVFSGSGVLVYVIFNVDSADPNDSSSLNLTNVTLNDDNATISNGDISLPVELVAFTAIPFDNRVTLKWRTATEVNNLGFAIFRSEGTAGEDAGSSGKYIKIGFVKGAGNSGITVTYQFTDEEVEEGKAYYYYLEDIDISGVRNKNMIIKVVVRPGVSALLILRKSRLLQNYPNPFNPETWIPYELAADSTVSIDIYNVQGQLIRHLALKEQKAGSYLTKDKATYWDGRDEFGQKVASGIYWYRLKAGKVNAIRRMVILK